MSRQVLFNGSILIRPGAATAIDASQFQNIPLNGIGTVGLIGEAVGGSPHTIQVFTNPSAVKTFYQSGDLVEAAAIAAQPGNDPRIPGGANLIVCYKMNSSTQSSFTWAATLEFLSLQYGVLQNNITVAVANGSPGYILTITTINPLTNAQQQEVSPVISSTGYLTIQYTGAGSAATLTINATELTTTCAGATADNLALNFSDYPTLTALVQAIQATGKYTAAILVTNAPSFNPDQLDAVTAADIKTSLTTLDAHNYDIANWINTNSQIISCVQTLGEAAVSTTLTTTPLTGGTRGTSSNTDWVNAFTALRTTRINQAVPLASADATTAQGTFTYTSVLAAGTAYATYASSTAGRNEVQLWSGMHGTQTAIITQANLQNSPHVCLLGQQTQRILTSTGTITLMPEWATAVTLAGMRAGATLGTPLTWKYIGSYGLASDSSWSETNDDDVDQMDLNGVIVINTINTAGFRIDKCITTYTQSDNDAYSEETIVQIWKGISYDLRASLANFFVGTAGNLNTIKLVPTVMSKVLELHRTAGDITDSVVNGQTIYAYRGMSASLSGDTLSAGVTITPTPGINYVLNTIVLVPAQITL
jgi:hypothetical protein